MSASTDGPTAGYGSAGAEESVAANRRWWDDETADYLAEHGDFLGSQRFVWGPEGLTEDEAGLLGPVAGLVGRHVLEVGCGAAQCGAWVAARGARVVGVDLSGAMLRAAERVLGLSEGDDGIGAGDLRVVQADARRLPFADAAFDVAFSSYGAVPFVADPELVMQEVARVLRPGGRWVFAITHPIRWAFPDDPGDEGLVATRSYFDTRPYTEREDGGRLHYAEHHRTLGQRVRDLVSAGLELVDLVEPTWPEENRRVWGGWSPRRGRLIPGTAIFVTRKPDPSKPH